MATKKTTTKKPPAAKAPAKKTTTAKKAPKAEAKPQGPRHPKGRVDAGGGKEALAKTLGAALAFGSDDADTVAGRLKTASNTQLLRLQRLVETVKKKWGSRDKLIQVITDAAKAGKDKDYVAKLDQFSNGRLLDMLGAAEGRSAAATPSASKTDGAKPPVAKVARAPKPAAAKPAPKAAAKKPAAKKPSKKKR